MNRENSSSTVQMADSRTPTPSFHNNNKGSFQNSTSSPSRNGSVMANGSLPESYITDDENPSSSLPSPRDKPIHLQNISVYTPAPPSPPPSATIPENDLSFIPPPPPPVKPDNAASILNSASEPNSEVDDEAGYSNPAIAIDEVDDAGQRSATESERSGTTGPEMDRLGTDGHSNSIMRNSKFTKTFMKQGDGWVHDDASFDSYDEEETEEYYQHRAALDVAL